MAKQKESIYLIGAESKVFADLGFTQPQATNLLIRSILINAIVHWYECSGLTQVGAAKQLSISQPRFNLLRKGKIGEFSLDALVNLVSAAGITLKLTQTQPRRISGKPPRT